jgi:hypothetical protein
MSLLDHDRVRGLAALSIRSRAAPSPCDGPQREAQPGSLAEKQQRYRVFQLHAMLTHPGIDPVSQARLSLQPLLVATDGIGRDEDPSSRVAGVMAALEHPWDAAPRQTPAGWRPDAATDAARADWKTYEAGWEAAQPWQAQARVISRLDLRAYEHDIQWAVGREARRPRDRRWDYTAWVVYINELARTQGDRSKASRTATLLPYDVRARRTRRLLAAPAPVLAAAGSAVEHLASLRRRNTR